jgi:hypothetical protein
VREQTLREERKQSPVLLQSKAHRTSPQEIGSFYVSQLPLLNINELAAVILAAQGATSCGGGNSPQARQLPGPGYKRLGRFRHVSVNTKG